MLIDWQHFTPWTALAGGVLIGLAAAMFILLNGRIAGISGIVGGLYRSDLKDASWRLAFILGLVAAPVLWQFAGQSLHTEISSSNYLLALAGLIVGIATRYAAGCTSGHGICGLSRLSLRSLLATLAFMATGVGTVFIMRHLL